MIHDLLNLMPLLVVLGGGILVLVVDLFAKSGPKGYLGWLTAATFAIAGMATYAVWKTNAPGLTNPYIARAFELDAFGLFWFVVTLFSGALTALTSVDHAREHDAEHGEFYALIAFAVAGMMIMGIAADLVVLILGIEIMSLSIYVLTGIQRRSPFAAEAALKYFIMGAVSSAILIYAAALLYGATGTTNLAAMAQHFQQVPPSHANLVPYLALLLMLAAFAFKVAAVPFHMWTPDAYEGAATPVTGLMAAGVKAASFAAFVRVLFVVFDSDGFRLMPLPWESAVVVLSILTMTIGNLIALHQRNVKRMLAYSSIAHAGYLLVAFLGVERFAVEGGGHWAIPSSSLFFYLFVYAAANLGAFGVVALLGARGQEDMDLDRLDGLGRRRPLSALAMTVCLLSLAGIPPTAGFLAKFFVFRDVLAVDGGRYLFLVVIAVINSLISVYYYLRPTVHMYFHEPAEDADERAPLLRSPAAYLAIAIAAVVTLHAGLLPGRYTSVAREAARSTVPAAARKAPARAAAPAPATAKEAQPADERSAAARR